MKDQWIGYCGVDCSACPDLIEKKCPSCRESTWPEGGECPPAACCRRKSIICCGTCLEFPCKMMDGFYKESESHRKAYERMEQIRSDLEFHAAMDAGNQENKFQAPEEEWQWCLVGNMKEVHEYGESHELRYGNKQFRPNAKVFINLVYGGMGHERILVIGTPRHTAHYIEIVVKRDVVENFRLQKVFKPAVLKRIKQSEWDWWGNTDSARDRIIRALESFNPPAAEEAKKKYWGSL